MDYINNNGEKIGSLTVAIGKDKTVTINRLNDVTTVTTQDRTTGKVSSETPSTNEFERAVRDCWDDLVKP
jgi:hypothetical protein